MVFQLGATPMSDNEPDDKYIYEIAVFTGIRRNAGTTSKVRTTCDCGSSYFTGAFTLPNTETDTETETDTDTDKLAKNPMGL